MIEIQELWFGILLFACYFLGFSVGLAVRREKK